MCFNKEHTQVYDACEQYKHIFILLFNLYDCNYGCLFGHLSLAMIVDEDLSSEYF